MALPNPVVVVPGITASDLCDAYAVSPETVWSTLLHKDYARIVLHPDDLRYELKEPARVVPAAVFGTPYDSFIEELRHNLTEHGDKPVPVYPFPYDWTRDSTNRPGSIWWATRWAAWSSRAISSDAVRAHRWRRSPRWARHSAVHWKRRSK